MKIEKDGRLLEVIGVSDLDGTVNDETLPEAQRITSIGPAKEAFAQLKEDLGMDIGGMSARSTGEVDKYSSVLGISGVSIGEDGAIILLPRGKTEKDVSHLVENSLVLPHNDRLALVLSKVNIATIQGFLRFIEEQAKLLDPQNHRPIVSSALSPIEKLWQTAGHESLELTDLSRQRLASAYVYPPDALYDLIQQHAPKFGIRAFRRIPKDPVMIFGQDAHKGDALDALNRHAEDFFDSDVRGILPIVWGNSGNDLPLFERAHEMGGLGIIVAHPNGGYAVPEGSIPDYVVKTKQPFGHGIKESLPRVYQHLKSR